MGIKGLFSFIQQYCKKTGSQTCVKSITLKDLKGKTIAIDTSIFVYKFVISCGTGGHYVAALKKFIDSIKKNEIRPVFVFDGIPPTQKQQTLDDRKAKQPIALVCDQDFANVRELIESMNVDIVDAPGEAEAQCAHLNRQGLVDCVASEDMDTLCFGAPCLIRNFNTSGKPMTQLTLDNVLKDLGMTNMEEFIDFCILCGSDYAVSPYGIGPIRAHGLITKQMKSLEKVAEENNMDPIPFKEARQLFIKPNVI
jgi:flap endonuclease-1